MPRKKLFTVRKNARKKRTDAAKQFARAGCKAPNVVLSIYDDPSNGFEDLHPIEPAPLDRIVEDLQQHLKEVHNSTRRLNYNVRRYKKLPFQDVAGQWPVVELEGNKSPSEDLPDFTDNNSWDTRAPDKASAHLVAHNKAVAEMIVHSDQRTMEANKNCFVCDEDLSSATTQKVVLLSTLSRYTRTGLPSKIGQLMGDGFMVVVTASDVVCVNCVDLINQMDKLEFELKKIQKTVSGFLHKKYGLLDVVKDEPLDTYGDGGFDNYGVSRGTATDYQTAVTEENSRICEMFVAAVNGVAETAEESTETNVIEENGKTVYKCSRCVLRFKDVIDLQNHEKIHSKILSKNREHACNKCDFKTSSKPVFDVHIRKHVVVKPFKCYHCNVRFTSKDELEKHTVSHSELHNVDALLESACVLEAAQSVELAESDGLKETYIDDKGILGEFKEGDDGEHTVTVVLSSGDNCEVEETDERVTSGSLEEGETGATTIFVDGMEVSLSQMVDNSMQDEGELEEGRYSEEEDYHPDAEEDSSDPSRLYACSACNYRCSKQSVLKLHLETHRGENLIECEMCGLKLKTQRTYDKHVKRHQLAPNPAVCTVCKQTLSDRLTLRKHMNDEHPMTYKCKYCNLVCTSVRARRKHESTHPAATMTRTCDVCGKAFRRSTQLQIHKEYAHRDPKCRICGKEFDKAVKLKEHERRHAREKDGLACNLCNKTFKTRSGLKLHRAKHTGQYKFCCDVCGRGFMSKVILEEHMGRHTKENRYTCDVCGKMFVFNSTMRIHRKWHDNPLPYKCVTCGQKFRHTSLLSVHRRRMHTGERPYKCPYCPLSFTVSSCLKRHVVLHTGEYPYFCDPCSKGFTTREKLAMHLAKIHNDREMLNTKARPCEYKVVLPNQPGHGPPNQKEDTISLLADPDHVVHINDMVQVDQMEQVEEVGHIIIQDDVDGLDAEGAIQLQIISMDSEHEIPGFE